MLLHNSLDIEYSKMSYRDNEALNLNNSIMWVQNHLPEIDVGNYQVFV